MTEVQLPSSLSEDAKEAIKKRLQEESGGEVTIDYTSNKVSPAMCESMQDMKSDGMTASEIADEMGISSNTTVYYHLREECSHQYRPKVTYSECGWMRIHSRNGARTPTLAVLYDLSEENVVEHLMGRCNHEDGIEPLTEDECRYTLHSEAGVTVSTCEMCGEEFEHKEYRNRTTCSIKCNAKYASHMNKV